MQAQYSRDSIVRETVDAAPSHCRIRGVEITSDAGGPLLAVPCGEIAAEPKSWSIRATAAPCTSSARTLRTAWAGPGQASVGSSRDLRVSLAVNQHAKLSPAWSAPLQV